MKNIKDLYEEVHEILFDPNFRPSEEETNANKLKKELVHMRRNKITA